MTASAPQKNSELPGVFDLLRTTFEVYRTNFSLLFGFAAWLLLPVAISFFASLSLEPNIALIIQIIALLVVYPVISIWIALAIIFLVPDLLAKKPPRLNDLNARIRRAAIPFFLTVIIVNLVQIGGLLALIVPGIIFSVWFAFPSIIVVLEQKNIIEAFKISKRLSKERFWYVFWLLFGAVIAFISFYIVLTGTVSLVFAVIAGGDFVAYLESGPSLGEQAITQIFDIFFFPLILIYTTVLYLTLKKKT
ncbi:MAG: hypothetical protein ABH826_03515 [Patescibacteria group bacterium]